MKNLGLILIFFLLMGCGTRKRAMQKKASELTKVEKKDVEKKQSITTNTNLAVIETSDKVTYRPLDNTRPIVVDGKEYTNTIIETEKKKQVDTSKVQRTESIELKDNSKTVIEEKKSQKTVEVERDYSFSFWDWLLLLLAMAIAWLIYRNRSRLLKFFN